MRLPRRLMRDRVIVRTAGGRGPYGPVPGTDHLVWGHAESSTETGTDSNGDVVVQDVVTVHLPPMAMLVDASGFVDVLAVVDDDTEVVLPDDTAQVTRQINTRQVHRVRGRTVSVVLSTTPA